MNASEELDELMECHDGSTRGVVEPCTIVIFGASGDLTARKLIPALYHLYIGGQMASPFRVIGFARREKSDDSFRTELHEGLKSFSRTEVDEAKWAEFAENVSYCRGDFSNDDGFHSLKNQLGEMPDERLSKNLLIYLATSPSQFVQVIEGCHRVGLLERDGDPRFWQRVVVEKPFGTDLDSAQQLNSDLLRYLHERQIFRIDHYLGKETVQNILVFRFSNSIFEQLWNRESIDHVQITVSEQMGVGERGGYYEESGALRDMVQNHLLQVLSLVAMEPPVSLDGEAVRDEKVKLLKSIRPLSKADVAEQVVRGQYFAGQVGDEVRPGYRQETKVKSDSNVETFVAMKLMIDNWRWSGVPFYLRTGKNLPHSASEVRVQFKPAPSVLFAKEKSASVGDNAIALRLQPQEGIYLGFNGKTPGTSMDLKRVRMHFSYDSEFGAYTPEAYERLLLESIAGEPTLFIRRDEVETAWNIVDTIRDAWKDVSLTNHEFYAAGTWGPVAADALIESEGHSWINPQPLS
ncbi:MAG: glucose-6-phosphate 1-dehydrogenase [Verrucomicrobiales bacterium]|jgi:glucose-6-phosphate 1-dehydrogenase